MLPIENRTIVSRLIDSMIRENSGVARWASISQAVAFAPFSQNSNARDFGFAHAQLTQAKPLLLFWCSRRRAPLSGTRIAHQCLGDRFCRTPSAGRPLVGSDASLRLVDRKLGPQHE